MTDVAAAGTATARVGLSAHATLWIVLIAVLLCGTACLWIAGLQIDLGSTLLLAEPVASFVVLAWLFWLLGSAFPSFRVFRRVTATFQDFFLSTAQFTTLAAISGLLIYLAAVSGSRFPMRDDELKYFDSLLGFDWYSVYFWLSRHPILDDILAIIYGTVYFQVLFIIIFNSIFNPGHCNAEFITLSFISIVITSFLFSFVPAAGMIGKFDMDFLIRLWDIRNGSTVMSYSCTSSMISFPSFHTVIAILIPYSLRHHHWCLIPVLLINVVMLVAISPDGGHYIADILAGAAVAVTSILMVRYCLAPGRHREHADVLPGCLAQSSGFRR